MKGGLHARTHVHVDRTGINDSVDRRQRQIDRLLNTTHTDIKGPVPKGELRSWNWLLFSMSLLSLIGACVGNVFPKTF